MNSIGWLGASIAPIAVATAAETYGMGVAISASSVVYLIVGLLLVFGIKSFMKPAQPAPVAA
jgi:ABC-type sulfate transport system permease component